MDVWRTFSGEGFFPFIHESLQNFILSAANRVSCPSAQDPSNLGHSSMCREETYLNPGPMVLRETKSARDMSSPAHRIQALSMSLFSPLGVVLRVTAMLAGWFVMLQFLDHVAGEAKKGFMWTYKAQRMSSLEMS